MHYTAQEEQTGQGIQVFANPSFGMVRTAGTPEDPKFCLTDLCSALDLTPSKVAQRLEEGVLSKYPLQTPGGIQQVNFVNEDGLYDVILDSRKPEAKAFRKWVTSEVLPAIRKTGGYIQTSDQDSDEEIMAKALLIAQKSIEQKQQRIQILEGERDSLQQQNRIMAPKAQYTDEVLQSTSTITFTELAKELNFRSSHVMLDRLVRDRVLYRQSGRYLPMAKYSGMGYFASRTHKFFHTDGSVGTSVTTVITEAGRQFLHNYFNKNA